MMAKKRKKDKKRDTVNLDDLFKEFDVDGNGYISAEELKSVLEKLGMKLTDREIKHMIAEADSDGDGVIDLEGWLLNSKILIVVEEIFCLRAFRVNF